MTEPADAAPEVRRLFFALWPDAALRARLTDLQQRLAPGAGRAVDGENLHITLLFLGATSAERRHCIEAGLAAVAGPPFSVQLDQLGYWRKPQVLWAGSALSPPALSALVQRLQDVAASCGSKVDARPFQVHLTLWRKLRKAPRELPAMAPIAWPVGDFALVESVTAGGGVRYRVLRRWALSAAAPGSTSG